MDATDINKIANRKRMNCDVEKLRDKVSRETAKIIKLKVAQDTAYWDLKEKLQAVESNHERLQRNMLEVQMQHEALSAQHQRERRQRPEAHARAAAARQLCDALDDYSARLRLALRRAAADRAHLARAYCAAGAAVSRAHDQHAAAAAAARAAAAHARRLETDLRAGADRLADELARRDRALQEKERTVAELLVEGERRAADLAEQRERTRVLGARLDEEVRAREAADDALRAAIDRRDAVVAELTAAGDALRDELATAAAARDALDAEVTRLRNLLEARSAELEAARGEVETLARDADALRQRAALAECARDECEGARAALAQDAQRARADAERELRELRDEAQRTAAARDELQADRDRLERELHDERERGAAAGAAAQRELASRADTIARLMADVAGEAEARARAEAAARGARGELEALGARAAELERAAHRREDALRDKDRELAAHAAFVRDLRAEKERLQEKICGMQSTIDNIQKELTRPPPSAAVDVGAAEMPEHDTAPVKAAPRVGTARRPDSLVYSFLSDSSVDGDALDASEVSRRFEAISKCAPSDLSLSQLKSGLQAKPRPIFKTKRLDSKIKKHK